MLYPHCRNVALTFRSAGWDGGLMPARRSALHEFREQSENVYENKGSWAGADIDFECLRCAEGAVRSIYPEFVS